MNKQLTIPEYIDQGKPNERWDITNKWNVGDRYIYINRIWECIDNTTNNAIWADVGFMRSKDSIQHMHADEDVKLIKAYEGNLVGATTQKDANDILDALVGGGLISISYDELLTKVTNGELKPGARYIINEFAQAYNVFDGGRRR